MAHTLCPAPPPAGAGAAKPPCPQRAKGNFAEQPPASAAAGAPCAADQQRAPPAALVQLERCLAGAPQSGAVRAQLVERAVATAVAHAVSLLGPAPGGALPATGAAAAAPGADTGERQAEAEMLLLRAEELTHQNQAALNFAGGGPARALARLKLRGSIFDALGRLERLRGRPAEALLYLLEAERCEHPDARPELRVNIAALQLHLGRPAEATAQAEAVAEGAAGDGATRAAAWHVLALARDASGAHEAAAQAWRSAVTVSRAALGAEHPLAAAIQRSALARARRRHAAALAARHSGGADSPPVAGAAETHGGTGASAAVVPAAAAPPGNLLVRLRHECVDARLAESRERMAQRLESLRRVQQPQCPVPPPRRPQPPLTAHPVDAASYISCVAASVASARRRAVSAQRSSIAAAAARRIAAAWRLGRARGELGERKRALAAVLLRREEAEAAQAQAARYVQQRAARATLQRCGRGCAGRLWARRLQSARDQWQAGVEVAERDLPLLGEQHGPPPAWHGPWLENISGTEGGSIAIPYGTTLLGSDAATMQLLLQGPSVRSSHCRFTSRDGAVDVQLLAEDGALFVNGAGVRPFQHAALHDGCRLAVGFDHMFRFHSPQEVSSEMHAVRACQPAPSRQLQVADVIIEPDHTVDRKWVNLDTGNLTAYLADLRHDIACLDQQPQAGPAAAAAPAEAAQTPLPAATGGAAEESWRSPAAEAAGTTHPAATASPGELSLRAAGARVELPPSASPPELSAAPGELSVRGAGAQAALPLSGLQSDLSATPGELSDRAAGARAALPPSVSPSELSTATGEHSARAAGARAVLPPSVSPSELSVAPGDLNTRNAGARCALPPSCSPSELSGPTCGEPSPRADCDAEAMRIMWRAGRRWQTVRFLRERGMVTAQVYLPDVGPDWGVPSVRPSEAKVGPDGVDVFASGGVSVCAIVPPKILDDSQVEFTFDPVGRVLTMWAAVADKQWEGLDMLTCSLQGHSPLAEVVHRPGLVALVRSTMAPS
eukprot:TRINITY_DN5888_c0_g1_i3.p1 TRINITY_DN5888_c0_g1~~TRINITY_DN5888_c0_g1_i3.p1  ORF type:complete len:1013 (+),score=204.05 TRINITY_DN5888_c0_g1_i3:72-3110(+)